MYRRTIHGMLSALGRMPLRTRLILAFVLLIISSASATIMIGNTVFGRKFDEIASDLVALYARLASQAMDARLEKMRLAARNFAAQHARGADPLALAETAGQEVPLDFILLHEPAGAPVLMQFPASDLQLRKPAIAPLPPDSSPLLRGAIPQALGTMLKHKVPAAGIAVCPNQEIAALAGGAESGEQLLFIAAAHPAKTGGVGVFMGRVLNGRTDMLEEAQRLIPSERKERLTVSIFLGGRRIASVRGEKAIGADAESEMVESVLRKGEPFASTARVRDENFFATYVPLRDPSGRPVAMLGISNSEDAIAEVRKRTILLFSSLIAGGMIFGFIMTFLFSRWLVSPISQLAEGMSRVAEGDLNYKVRIESADELGKLAGAFNQMVRAVKERDLKLREMTDDRLTQVEKQISIGRLAAGVAHEINNPLTAILSLSSLWLRKMPADDPRREDLEIVVSETSRCREIVRSLLDFARERPMEKRRIDITAIVRETLVLAKKYESMANVKVESRLSALPLAIHADAKLLQQVFMNLLLNAAEATGRGGTISVETDEDSSGHFAQVRVIDYGKGIPKEHINRVFEPFFTTKGTGKGTGLGLSVSLGIVQKHEGTIEIESAEGEGTTVTVLLPRMEESPR